MGEVMVTGATGGVGRCLVSVLLEAGHRVTAVGRDTSRLRSLGDVRPITLDLAALERLPEAIEPVERLDALVHCAGVSLAAVAPVADTGPEAWRETMTVNVLAAAD